MPSSKIEQTVDTCVKLYRPTSSSQRPPYWRLSARLGCRTLEITLLAALSIAAGPRLSFGQPAGDSPHNLYLSGRYDEAIEAYAKLSTRSPQEEIELAYCHWEQGKRAAAREVLTAATTRLPETAVLPAELALLEFSSGDYDAARRWMDAALELDGDCIAARWLQAELFRLHGKLDDAQQGYEWLIRHFNSGAAISGNADRRFIGLAAAQYARWSRNHNQFKRLVTDLYPAMLAREPNYWPAHLEMARLFAEKYNEADAAEAIAAGLAINPQATDLHVMRAQLALDKFDLATAKTSVERALAIDPKHVGAFRMRADILLADVRPADAIAVLEEARALQPRDEETLGRLAAAYAAVDGFPSGKPAPRMQAIIKEVEKFNPHCGAFYLAAGDALDRMRRFPQAAEQYRLAQIKMPQLVAARGKLGMTLMRLGNETDAARLLNEAFTIDPFNVRVKNTLEVLEVLSGYAVLETQHFVLKFDRGRDELLATYASRHLEREVYPRLVKEFGFEPEGKTLIEIFSRNRNTSGHGWFSARMAGLPAIGTVGACAGRMIALTSPEELEQKFDWARVLSHEYVHVLNLQQTDFCIPHWFTEGLAVRSEQAPRPRAWNEVLSRRARQNKLFDLDSLTLGFVRPSSSDDWALAYCQAALHVDYMHDKFGADAAGKMLAAYSRRQSTAEAIEQALGIRQEEYEQGYRQYVRDHLAELGFAGNDDPSSFADQQAAAERQGATAADLATFAKAHLERKNLPAARRWAVAARETDPKNPLAAYVLARIHLSIGDGNEAIALLEQAFDEERPHEDLLALLSVMKLQAEEWDDAERLHDLGRRHFPASDRWLKGLARIYLQVAEPEKLYGVLESLAELEPDSRSIRKKLAALALAKGDFIAARRWAEASIHLDLQDAEAHAQLAAAAHGGRDRELAAEEYETAVKLDPEKHAWRFAWAAVLTELERLDDARQVAEDLQRLEADYPGLAGLLEKLQRE